MKSKSKSKSMSGPVVLFVQPGWVLAGTLVRKTRRYLHLIDVIYVEQIQGGRDAMGGVARAATLEEQQRVLSRWWTWPPTKVARNQVGIILQARKGMAELISGAVLPPGWIAPPERTDP